MAVFEVPLVGTPQRFPITLSDVTYIFTFRFRNPGLPGTGGTWVLDIGDEFDTPLVCGIPLVTGADLLAQYPYLGFGGGMIVISNGDKAAVPTFDNLGTDSHLYWITP
jgi:hypothetical protein